MAIRLEVLDSSDGSYKVSLEGGVYLINIRWNTRTAAWYMSVTNEDGVIITKSEKILPNQALVSFNLTEFTTGNIYAVNTTSNSDEQLNRSNLGADKTFELLYLREEEIS